MIYHRTDRDKNDIIFSTNSELKGICKVHGECVIYGHENVTLTNDGQINQNAYYDDLHPHNRTGTRRLAANLKNALGLRKMQPRRRRPQDNQRRNCWTSERDHFRPATTNSGNYR